MYETTFKDLGVSLPFDCFAIDVLKILGVAPSQLHPNNWVSMQAFLVICQALALIPSTSLFLSHYTLGLAKAQAGSPWPYSPREAYSTPKRPLTRVYALCGASFAFVSKPLPLYWRLPSKFKGLSRGQLTSEEQASLYLLEELPRGMSCRELVAISFTSQPLQNLKGDILAAQASKARASSLAPTSHGASNSKDVVVVATKKVASKEVGAEKVPACPSQADPALSAMRKAPAT
ncbi:hypothetical protein CR513_36132, partial [Mucuna pruriens]